MNDLNVVKKLSEEAYNFIMRIQEEELSDGHYELGNGVYANVETYMSKPRSERQFENHRKYIDVQIVVDGEELMELFPVNAFSKKSFYDMERDTSFFNNDETGEKFQLTKGDFLIIFPGQAHMPCVQVNKSSLVKKAVVKIPIETLPKLLFMDVDGTLTDGKIYMGNDGELAKGFNIKDGYAIAHILPQNGIIPVIITGRESIFVSKRSKELGIEHCLQNVSEKKRTMIQVANSYGLYLNEDGILPRTAYIGDDIPDYESMLIAEKKGCPADAVEQIREKADFVASKKGGEGAVREFIEWLCKD